MFLGVDAFLRIRGAFASGSTRTCFGTEQCFKRSGRVKARTSFVTFRFDFAFAFGVEVHFDFLIHVIFLSSVFGRSGGTRTRNQGVMSTLL